MSARDRPCCLLVDNGSLSPAPTLGLRALAAELSERIGDAVHPVSAQHSDRVARAELGGEAAQVIGPFLAAQRARGRDSFLVVPLFFGHSVAIAEHLPGRVQILRQTWSELELRIAPPLIDIDSPADTAVAEILADRVRRRIASAGLSKPALAVLDHGSPRRAVAEARDLVAKQLAALLGDTVAGVRACSMERRAGEAFAFNEPLLESLLGTEGFDRQVVLATLFHFPGRHAGPGGDIERICRSVETQSADLRIFPTELFAGHPDLIDLLAKRYQQGIGSAPVTAP